MNNTSCFGGNPCDNFVPFKPVNEPYLDSQRHFYLSQSGKMLLNSWNWDTYWWSRWPVNHESHILGSDSSLASAAANRRPRQI